MIDAQTGFNNGTEAEAVYRRHSQSGVASAHRGDVRAGANATYCREERYFRGGDGRVAPTKERRLQGIQFILSRARSQIRVVIVNTTLMKGTEVPNPRRSSVICDCTLASYPGG